jgi:hypothetical protein
MDCLASRMTLTINFRPRGAWEQRSQTVPAIIRRSCA